jgi:hypothetical protein
MVGEHDGNGEEAIAFGPLKLFAAARFLKKDGSAIRRSISLLL